MCRERYNSSNPTNRQYPIFECGRRRSHSHVRMGATTLRMIYTVNGDVMIEQSERSSSRDRRHFAKLQFGPNHNLFEALTPFYRSPDTMTHVGRHGLFLYSLQTVPIEHAYGDDADQGEA